MGIQETDENKIKVNKIHPTSFWISAFYFPQGFIVLF